MKISTKGRYSLRMLVDLAEHKDEGFVALQTIAERQEISKKYLEQIAAMLARADLLRANRGSQGGYMLAKEPVSYTVGEILRLTEGDFSPVACLEDRPNRCGRSSFCRTLPIWQGLGDIIANYFDNITLQDILERTDEIDAGNRGMFI